MDVDLHTHTLASDGSYKPMHLVRKAKRLRLKAIAITDHDTVNGIDEAVKAGNKMGIEVIPGIELSCGLLGFKGKYKHIELHLVGLFIDWKNKELKKKINYIRTKGREKRAKLMLKILREKSGISISYAELIKINKKIRKQIGLIQIVEILARRGLAKDWHDSKAYRDVINMAVQYDVKDAIKIIKKAGGISFLAHSLNSLHRLRPKPTFSEYEKILKHLKSIGLDGIETNYCNSSASEKRFLSRMADKYHFLKSGGTDYHRHNRKTMLNLGELPVPYSYLRAMKEHLLKNR